MAGCCGHRDDCWSSAHWSYTHFGGFWRQRPNVVATFADFTKQYAEIVDRLPFEMRMLWSFHCTDYLWKKRTESRHPTKVLQPLL